MSVVRGNYYYTADYVHTWTRRGPIDDMSLTLLAICAVLLFILLVLLIYAYVNIRKEKLIEEYLKVRIEISMQTTLSYILLCVTLITMKKQHLNIQECVVNVGFLLFALIVTVTWLATSTVSLSIQVLYKKDFKRYIYYTTAWGLPLTLVSILISSDYTTDHEVILDVAECWFKSDTQLGFLIQLLPVSSIFVVHVTVLVCTNIGAIWKSNKLTNTQKDYIKYSSLDSYLLIFPGYAVLVYVGLLFHRYDLLYEYVVIGAISLQVLLITMRCLVQDSMVKNSLVDSARRKYLLNQSTRSLASRKIPMHVP